MCIFGGDSGDSSAASAQIAAQQQALTKDLTNTGAPIPVSSGETQAAAVNRTIQSARAQQGVSAAYLTSGGGAGDPNYG